MVAKITNDNEIQGFEATTQAEDSGKRDVPGITVLEHRVEP